MLEVAFDLVRASLEVVLVPQPRLASRLGEALPVAPAAPAVVAEAPRAPRPELILVRRTVDGVADRLPWRPRCLVRAMAAQRVLRRRGRPAELHLGVARGDSLRAHAWLTSQGYPVVGGRGNGPFVTVATRELPSRG